MKSEETAFEEQFAAITADSGPTSPYSANSPEPALEESTESVEKEEGDSPITNSELIPFDS